MVEVFKTNVNDPEHANMLANHIHDTFIDYKVNFDLEDCDNILRVQSMSGIIQPSILINFLKNHGCDAEVLADDAF